MFDKTNQAQKKGLSHGKTNRRDELPERLFDDPMPQKAAGNPLDAESMTEGIERTALQVPEERADAMPKGLLPFRLFDDETENPTAKPADAENTISIKYNGEMIDLPISEAIVLAQKGMNYDHMLSEREREAAAIERMAAQAGIPRGEYLSLLEERGGDFSPQEAAWRRLLTDYPDVSIEELPVEFFQKIDEGKSPVEVYQQMLIDDLKSRIAIAEKSAENRRRSIGSARGDAQETVRDAFLEGFLGI